jgi:hypothetical protein
VDLEIQLHNFHEDGDIDYVKFTAQQNYTYTIKTSKVAADNDTVLYLYNPACDTILTWNDNDLVDPVNAPFSRIDWVCPTTDIYFVKVKRFDDTGGCEDEYEYKLQITATAP